VLDSGGAFLKHFEDAANAPLAHLTAASARSVSTL